jgi:hypothetical protein
LGVERVHVAPELLDHWTGEVTSLVRRLIVAVGSSLFAGTRRRPSWPARCVSIAGVLAACGGGTGRAIPVQSLLRQAARFDGREVTVHGRARDIVKLPFVRQRFFRVTDTTGSILVVTYDTVPSLGALTTVRGRFSTVAVLGDSGYGGHIVVEPPRPAGRD